MVRNAIIVVMILFLIGGGAYAGGLALSGVGSKAIGMGGAFRGLADNWSAAYWNPAGLAQLEQSEFNFMGIAIDPRPEYTPNIWQASTDSTILYDIGYRNGQVLYPNDETHLAANLSGFWKMSNRENLTFGLSIFVPYALGSEWDLYNPIYDDVNGQFPDWDHEADLQVIDFHPTVATKLMDGKLMLGAGLSIMKGKVTFRKTALSPTGLPYPHNNVAVDALIEGDGWGYGANFGMLYKLSDKLQVGISGKTPTTLKLNGDVTTTLYTINNSILYQQALSQAGTLADSVGLDFIFDIANNERWKREADADLKLPADIGLGFAYMASEKLTMTLDFTYTMWSRLDSLIIDMEGAAPPAYDPTDTLLVIRTEWDNTLRISLGGLYQMSEPLAWRFGFYYDPTPIPDKTFSPLFLDIGDKYSLNIGPAYQIGDWELGYNFEYIFFKEREVPLYYGSDTTRDNYPGLFKAYLVANHISVTYRF